jgi:hypothetical protein
MSEAAHQPANGRRQVFSPRKSLPRNGAGYCIGERSRNPGFFPRMLGCRTCRRCYRIVRKDVTIGRTGSEPIAQTSLTPGKERHGKERHH